MSTNNETNLHNISQISMGAKVDEVEKDLVGHIEVCGKRHAVINTKLDALSSDVRDVRGLIIELARQDGRQDAKIEAVEQAKTAGGKAGAVVGGGLATVITALATLGKTLGWW